MSGDDEDHSHHYENNRGPRRPCATPPEFRAQSSRPGLADELATVLDQVCPSRVAFVISRSPQRAISACCMPNRWGDATSFLMHQLQLDTAPWLSPIPQPTLDLPKSAELSGLTAAGRRQPHRAAVRQLYQVITAKTTTEDAS